jgi:enoyl-[acyl-carrier protein] reductase III
MTILVTGGSSGIGLAIAKRFAAAGAQVFVNYHSDEGAARRAREELSDGGAVFIKADLGQAEGVQFLVDQVRRHTGRLDQLVHCAAATVPGRLTEVTSEELARSVAVNGLALVGLVRAAGELLTAGSSVVYLSSQGAREVITGYGALGIAKALGEHAVRYLAVELAPRGIRVNTVAPGMLDTKAVRAMFPGRYDKIAAAAARSNPADRPLAFDDVSSVVEQLCRPGFAMVQGQVISVDGGASLR